MIVIEERLMELFDQLPALTYVDANGNTQTTPKPVYHFGDGIECNKFIEKSAENGVSPYPLIYQTSTRWNGDPEMSLTTDLVLVLCVQNLNQDMFNTERWVTSYRNVLQPLSQNIDKALKRSGIITANYKEYSFTNYPNYSQTESKDNNAFLDVIDALEIRIKVIMSDNCINTINFNF